jgi:hypothetical protein
MANQSNAAIGRTTVVIQLVSFAKDILPLFRPLDVEHMQAFDVRFDDYTYMSAASNNTGTRRPCAIFSLAHASPECRLAARSGPRSNWRCSSAG